MNTVALRSLIQRIHFYGGMFVGPFILIAALSGCLYAVAPTIEKVVYHDVLSVPAVSQPLSLEQQVHAAQMAHPGLAVTQVWPADQPTDSTRVLLSDPSLGEDRNRAMFIDPATAQVIGDEPTYSGLGELPVRFWISQLHKNLHLGEPGRVYAELAASWMWLLALGGAYLWWRRWSAQRGRAKQSRLTGSPRLRLIRQHGVLGTWLIIAMLGLSATGITWSLFAGDNVHKTVDALHWKATPIIINLDGTPTKASATGSAELTQSQKVELASIAAEQADAAFTTGRSEGLTGSLRLYPPKNLESGWKVSERWTEGRMTSDQISVNGATEEVIDRQPFSSLPLFSKLTNWGIYLHMGIMFGLPLQILLLPTGLAIAVMSVLGYMMWWKRRPSFTPGSAKHFSWATTGLGVVFVLTVGVFLPTLGVTLAIFLTVDALLLLRKNQPSPTAEVAQSKPEPEMAVTP